MQVVLGLALTATYNVCTTKTYACVAQLVDVNLLNDHSFLHNRPWHPDIA